MFQWSIISFLVIFIKSFEVNTIDNLCNYIVSKSDNGFDICLSDQCNKYMDPYEIMVKPNNCKTELLYLSFSSYKNFSLFVNRIPWKLGDLFPSKLNNQIRLLRIFIDYMDNDDQPTDHNELIRLGIHIDLYELFIKNITNNNKLHGLIHYDQNYPQWFIVKVEFICNSLMIYQENRCSIKILPTSPFAPQRPLFTKEKENLLSTNFEYSSLISSSNQKFYKNNHEFTNLLLAILIPILIALFLLTGLILIYKKILIKQCSNMDLIKTSTPSCSSIPSLSNDLQMNNSSIIAENVHHMDQTQNPIKSLDYHHHTKNQFTNKRNDIYERISLDNHSLFGQQHFTPISSSSRF
ncbi:unnamed protein product [Rotaria magnacalcarata]|uniref:Uncharacterized protein n=1 Tax=Rotaria magnacalcarata TaxID=392030 RepID=A0A815MVW5_9BILA|nr:unnamed protein product [Rotaria magnacalcarata]CAF1426711.1 unnamed protein product [Rotaria magnacalcarata]CAF2054310.1 unnamed protein product [Rotaria magnacalcarata]CAF2075923.1 unnamed protein product [Rotaria magnacalcarata]CAF2210301.1 unnamed protein product [Rotaria magnacalcarata]